MSPSGMRGSRFPQNHNPIASAAPVRTGQSASRSAAGASPSPVSPSAVVGTQWEPYVAAVVQVERIVHAFQPATGLWKTSTETSFYLCNCMIDANRAAIAVRMHWGIENKLHYTRDVTLREDASRIRKNPGVFAKNSKLRLQYSPVQSIRHNPTRPLRRRSRRSQIHIFYDNQ